MPETIHDRIARLEKAVLHFEGALFAHHDVTANILAALPDTERRRTIAALKSYAEDLGSELGQDRIAGYREELLSIEQEVEQSRVTPSGIFRLIKRL